jgi:hypothetical protein
MGLALGDIDPRDLSQTHTQQVHDYLLSDLFSFAYIIMEAAGFLYPPVHAPICKFIERWGEPGRRRLMVQVPRDAGKTTIATRANALWQICRDPDAPVAIFNERLENASKWLKAIRELVQSSRLFSTIFPDMVPPGVAPGDTRSLPRWWKWNDNELLFQRGRMGIPEASLTGLGIGAASTGGHWPKIIKDDIVSVRAAESPSEMESAKFWFDRSFFLEAPAMNGMDLVVCTPWSHDDVYVHALRNYQYLLYRRGGLENGVSIWPEKMPTEMLLRFQERDPVGFASQIMCLPTAGSDRSFKPEWLRRASVVWNSEDPYVTIDSDSYDPLINEIEDDTDPPPIRVPLSQLTKLILVDPAPTEKSDRRREPGARNALVVVGRDAWGRRYLLDEWVSRDDPHVVILKMIQLCQRWGTVRVGIEEVNFSRLYRHWLLREADLRGIALAPFPLHTRGREKEARIMAMVAPTKQGWWYICRGTPSFEQEYREYPYSGTRDVIDAWAYSQDCLSRPTSMAEEVHREWVRRHASATRDVVTGY